MTIEETTMNRDDDKQLPFEIHIPDVIAHRGFSAKNPENTLISYKNAIEAGTSALEGDIRLSKDKEIVMMHDLTLNRTTTGTGAVHDQDWYGYIDKLTTKTNPPQPIPRLNDVLDLLLTTTNDKLYMIVDIKYDNPIEILNVLSNLLNEDYVKEYPQLTHQLIIGIWSLEFLERAKILFPQFKLCFIGLSISAARTHFIESVDCLSLPFAALANEDGQLFIKEAHTRKKKVFSWTINDPDQMKTCVLWKIDGIIGDNVTTLIENVQRIPKSIVSLDDYQVFINTDHFLISKRRRLYYYILAKIMQFVSWKIIGV
ncbi:PLC-like phosphodiesterase [Cokeromyces recurvatus]|uniref:PLC-like phosphodiesterase n=1 Tax=Cokeromyces recurvatus TaxID=90255 RepID=UPI00221E3BF9|nr:PLC-like phosphodiesterase [Cokeromyces recurvatus]KAI7902699.1 PLC-like phosphodiesterase [Cokeromyces recurvatus]